MVDYAGVANTSWQRVDNGKPFMGIAIKNNSVARVLQYSFDRNQSKIHTVQTSDADLIGGIKKDCIFVKTTAGTVNYEIFVAEYQ